MNGCQRKKFSALMMSIGEVYNITFSPPLLKLYWSSLARFDYEKVSDAFWQHINHPDVGRYSPKPADIIRHIQGSLRDNADNAWIIVCKDIQRVGAYNTATFDDTLIHAVIEDMGGWVKLCHTSSEQLLARRAEQFQRRYQWYLQHPPEHVPEQLSGIFKCKENARHEIVGQQSR